MDESLRRWREIYQIDEHAYGQLLAILSNFGPTNEGYVCAPPPQTITLEGSLSSPGDFRLCHPIPPGYCSRDLTQPAFPKWVGFHDLNLTDVDVNECNQYNTDSCNIYPYGSTSDARNISARNPNYGGATFETRVGEAFNDGSKAQVPSPVTGFEEKYEIACFRCRRRKRPVGLVDTILGFGLTISQCTSTKSGPCDLCTRSKISPQLCVRVRLVDYTVFSKCLHKCFHTSLMKLIAKRGSCYLSIEIGLAGSLQGICTYTCVVVP